MRAAFPEVPANRFFNFQLLAHTDESAEVSLPLRPEYLQEGGVVHGGIISTLADSTAVYIIYPTLPETQSMASIEFKINFLRPARAEAGNLRAVARLVKRGRKVVLCDVEVFQQDALVAKGLFTYLLLASS